MSPAEDTAGSADPSLPSKSRIHSTYMDAPIWHGDRI